MECLLEGLIEVNEGKLNVVHGDHFTQQLVSLVDCLCVNFEHLLVMCE